MGEGLYRSRQGRTAHVDPEESVEPEDWLDAGLRHDNLVADICALLPPAWEPVANAWRERSGRVVARNALHEIWLTGDSYGRIHVTFGVRSGLDGTDALAWHWLDDRAAAFFDRLQAFYPLRVRTSPWKSAPRAPCALRRTGA